ncbi:maleylacetate reductase and hydroxyquinol 1,2-dioxygenase domain-containing protein [Streptomyces sp. NPDC002143]
MRTFSYTTHPGRIIFGTGTAGTVRQEAERLGCRRVLLVSSPGRHPGVEPVRAALGDLLVASFDGAAVHTPADITAKAMDVLTENRCDGVVAVGGGSATGLSKALAARTGLPQLVIPTTYAGSEVTPVLGETRDGVKTTRSGPEILPETVVYDVELTLGLPVPLSVTSGINALAHAVEALYSPDANPVIDSFALDAVARIAGGLRRVVAAPHDVDARADLLHSAWLAGTCLGAVGMGLHHKLCHTVGAALDLPHAETHTVMLPHAMAYNAAAAPEAMDRIAAALGAADAPAGVFDLIAELGGPTSLRDLGVAEGSLSALAEAAAARAYPNPAPLSVPGIAALLAAAWRGDRPRPGRPTLPATIRDLSARVAASFADSPSPRTGALLTDLARRLHAFVLDNDIRESEWTHAIEFLTRTGHITSPTRQEFILLSDTLGVSSAVDALSNSRDPRATPSAVLGPFYTDNPPPLPDGADIARGADGVPLWVDITVAEVDGTPIPDATVDVWQSDDDGFYDVQLSHLDGPVLRARLRSGADGHVRFWSILPSEYPIPDDGPVGEMLAATGRHPYRAPHLHFLVETGDGRRLVTQFFVAGGSYLDSDAVFGVKETLIKEFTPQSGPAPDGRSPEGEWRLLRHDLIMAGPDS